MKKAFQTGSMKKTITINASKEKVWRTISNIIGLTSWGVGIKDTTFLSKKRTGVGAIRKITFTDNNVIEEHVVGWKNGESLTYAATDGLPLRIYFATMSISQKGKNTVSVTWQSYFNSKKMSPNQFREFVDYLELFYAESLKNLKALLEKKQ